MADRSSIEWTDATWNPITGCSVVSPGCTHCYAMRLAGTRLAQHTSRAGLTIQTKTGPVWNGNVRLNKEWLYQPLSWRRPRMIFVCAHGDLFHENVPDGWIMAVLRIMAMTPWHTYQVLTKRTDRMRDFFAKWADLSGEDLADFKDARGPEEVRRAHPSGRGQLFAAWLETLLEMSGGKVPDEAAWPTFDWMNGEAWWPNVFHNIWVGVSVEDQRRADERRDNLGALADMGWTTFVSYEPALGPVDWNGWEFLRWLISGGESGRDARPNHPDWHRAARDFCARNGIPYFFKQWGSHRVVYDRDADDPHWRRCSDIERKNPSGRWLNLEGGHGFHGERVVYVVPSNKKAAGRLLDGREHNDVPRPWNAGA
jgi:protein gp37